jgi:hypothetical protein
MRAAVHQVMAKASKVLVLVIHDFAVMRHNVLVHRSALPSIDALELELAVVVRSST